MECSKDYEHLPQTNLPGCQLRKEPSFSADAEEVVGRTLSHSSSRRTHCFHSNGSFLPVTTLQNITCLSPGIGAKGQAGNAD